MAAKAVAEEAARTAAAIQLRADAAAVKVAEAASRAAAIVAEASPPGSERESALTALRLAVTVRAAAVATAEDTAAAAASRRQRRLRGRCRGAFTVSAAAVAYESEVAQVAAAVQATATATARQVAAETDVRATDAAAFGERGSRGNASSGRPEGQLGRHQLADSRPGDAQGGLHSRVVSASCPNGKDSATRG